MSHAPMTYSNEGSKCPELYGTLEERERCEN